MKKILLIISVLLIPVFCYSQQNQKGKKKEEVSKCLSAFIDTIKVIKDRVYAVDSMYWERPIQYDVNMYRMFMAPVIYNAPINQKMMANFVPESLQKQVDLPDSMSLDKFSVIGNRIDTVVNNALYNLYLSNFRLNYITEHDIAKYESFNPVLVNDTPVKDEVFTLFKPENDYNQAKKVESTISVNKPNFWKLQGSGSIQFSQNFISKNWYKGGESSNSILSYLMFNANYNDKSKIEFDNRLEAKVGFMTVPSDTLHKYNINSDLLRFTTKLGLKAFDRWYYTVSAEFNTQFFQSYKINSDIRVSSFMAPANLIFNIGLDYKLSKEKIELSTLFSPLTYNFRYVGDPLVDETQFGLEEGKKVLNSFGSTFQLNMKWTIISSIIWESRFNYFTSYHKIETEWENTFNFILNRYLSAKLFVHARYYDMEAEHKIQWNELFSFGINYNW